MEATVTALGELGRAKKPSRPRTVAARTTRSNKRHITPRSTKRTGLISPPVISLTPSAPAPAPYYPPPPSVSLHPTYRMNDDGVIEPLERYNPLPRVDPRERTGDFTQPMPPQPGDSKFNTAIGFGTRILDAITGRSSGGGNNQTQPGGGNPNDPNTVGNTGRNLGQNAGNFVDGIVQTVKANPLIFLMLGGGAFLLFKEPPRRGK